MQGTFPDNIMMLNALQIVEIHFRRLRILGGGFGCDLRPFPETPGLVVDRAGVLHVNLDHAATVMRLVQFPSFRLDWRFAISAILSSQCRKACSFSFSCLIIFQ